MLEDIRKEIDIVDNNIVELLRKRKNLAKEVAKIKKEANKPIFDPEREKQLLEKLRLKAKEKNLDEEFIIGIYRLILKNSKEEQEKTIKK
jgi:chorismate mutase